MKRPCHYLGGILTLLVLAQTLHHPAYGQQFVPDKPPSSLRVACFNASLNRSHEGALAEDLRNGDAQARSIATIVRAVKPDVLLLNELDYSTASDNADLFETKYLRNEQPDLLGGAAWPMDYHYAASVNTGMASGLDLDRDGVLEEPEDAYGFGRFPGQYGMAIFSRFEILESDVVTLQKFPWSGLPGALRPTNADGTPFYDDATWRELRLSSKSFWDVPIKTSQGIVHFLASHPTPPAFDGQEDRNGCRNHDEIRLIEHYITASSALISDTGSAVTFKNEWPFVVLGDLNCDPHDGDGRPAAIKSLLAHPRLSRFPAPRSNGAAQASLKQGNANLTHRGDPAEDTADFADNRVGNLRADYVLPSRHFQVLASGVFWPTVDGADKSHATVGKLLAATDHHMVYVDVQLNP
jgi:hypothetical protein